MPYEEVDLSKIDLSTLSPENAKLLLENLEELKRRQQSDPISYYEPYVPQLTFHNHGDEFRERALIAGNQQGKSFSASMETAIHATGLYPKWWKGKKFNKPIRGWVMGPTNEAMVGTVQRLLLGPINAPGTGSIPAEAILKTTMARGVSDSVDTILVRHKSGGTSQLSFRSYGRGREKLQGESLDLIHIDEEPPADIYTELLARISARKGIIYATFTPLLGMSEVVQRFLSDESPHRVFVQAGIKDALHISEEEQQAIIDSYPAHEREARIEGKPMLGSGAVYPFNFDQMLYDPAEFQIPDHFVWIAGIDFGWDHPTAAVKIAWDRDSDAIYVTNIYKRRQATPLEHCGALRMWGTWLPFAWPLDGLQTGKGDGEQLTNIYRNNGLQMLVEHARFDDSRNNSVEAGIMELAEAMQTGRFFISGHLDELKQELSTYHRKDGRIVKLNDDLVDALRYAWVMRRFSVPTGHNRFVSNRPLTPRYANNEYNIFSDDAPGGM